MRNFMHLEQIRQIQKTYEACWRSTLLSPQAMNEVLRQTRETISMASALADVHFRDASLLSLEAQRAMLVRAAEAAIAHQEEIARVISHAVRLSRLDWEQAFAKWHANAAALIPSGFFESLKAVELQVSRLAETSHFTNAIGKTLLRTTLKNADVFQNLQAARFNEFVVDSRLAHQIADLPVAADFVLDYTRFLPRVARLQGFREAKREMDIDPNWRGEEIGPRLEAQLQRLDKRLVELRRRAWEAMGKEGPAALRLAAHAMRELFGEVLRMLAPDEEVKTSAAWLERADRTQSRPTRETRLKLLLGSQPEKLATVLQFRRSLDKAHGFAHTFPEDRELVRVDLSELEKCVYLLLVYTNRDEGTE